MTALREQTLTQSAAAFLRDTTTERRLFLSKCILMVVLRCKHIVIDNCGQYLYDGVFVRSFSEDGIETAETAYALALAYTNVHDDEAESMSPCRNCSS